MHRDNRRHCVQGQSGSN